MIFIKKNLNKMHSLKKEEFSTTEAEPSEQKKLYLFERP